MVLNIWLTFTRRILSVARPRIKHMQTTLDNKLIRGTYLSSNKSNLRHDNKSILNFSPSNPKHAKSPDAAHQPRHLISPLSPSVITSHRWKQQNSHASALHQSTSPNLRTHDSVEKFLEPADARRRMIRGWKESNATHVKVNANVKPKLYYNPVHFLPSILPSFLPFFLLLRHHRSLCFGLSR
jgi:hypothetical protein